MSPVLYCGHSQERVVYHEARLEFGVDRLLPHPGWRPVDVQGTRAMPARRRYYKPGWPKGWPKPPTWTYTWFR